MPQVELSLIERKATQKREVPEMQTRACIAKKFEDYPKPKSLLKEDMLLMHCKEVRGNCRSLYLGKTYNSP